MPHLLTRFQHLLQPEQRLLPKRAEMRRKLAAHGQYLESGRCRDRFGVAQVAVLWLTNAAGKRDRILKRWPHRPTGTGFWWA